MSVCQMSHFNVTVFHLFEYSRGTFMLLIPKAKELYNLAFSSVEVSGAFAFSCWKLAIVGVGLGGLFV